MPLEPSQSPTVGSTKDESPCLMKGHPAVLVPQQEKKRPLKAEMAWFHGFFCHGFIVLFEGLFFVPFVLFSFFLHVFLHVRV